MGNLFIHFFCIPKLKYYFVNCNHSTDNFTIKIDIICIKINIYIILRYNLQGQKKILGLWMDSTESKNYWMQVFDEIKARGVEDIFFISMDGVSGLESGAKAIFPGVVVQRCIVHLIRNSIRYVPTKDYKKFTSDLKKVYGASSLKAAKTAFDTFCDNWKQHPGAIESVNSSFRKVTKKGSFPNHEAVFKLLYLWVKELQKKWDKGHLNNWLMVLNQLLVNDQFKDRIEKYIQY